MGSREKVARYAAPAAFLAALTIAVLLIRSGLGGGGSTPTVVIPTTTAVATTRAARGRRTTTTSAATTTATTTASSAGFYVVQRGDTYGSIGAKYGISIQQLESLNPGLSPTSLSIGQRIRVK
ncbi:MAG: LysM domain-containing protein [Gaiellaceae bacterium]